MASSIRLASAKLLHWIQSTPLRGSGGVIARAWPPNAPNSTFNNPSRFFGLEQVYPTMLFTDQTLCSQIKAFLRRGALFRSHALAEERVQACSGKIEEIAHAVTNISRTIDELIRDFEENQESKSPQELEAIGLEVEKLKGQMERRTKYGDDLTHERTMLMACMLQQHMQVWDSQIEADHDLKVHLENHGLLKDDLQEVLDVWTKFPIGDYEGGTFRRVAGQVYPFLHKVDNSELQEFAREEVSYCSAIINHEIAAKNVTAARRAFERRQHAQVLQEEQYRALGLAGQAIMSPQVASDVMHS